MISKNTLEKSILHECTVCKHLHGKFTAAGFEYRPTPEQRSTLELLRYLAVVGIATMKSMDAGDWGPWKQYSASVAQMTADEFPAAMDRQMEEIRAMFAGITQEEMETRIVRMPWGEEVPFDLAMMESLLKWFTGYKMQLFLYAKATGAADLSTPNCWMGIDVPAREEKVEEAAV